MTDKLLNINEVCELLKLDRDQVKELVDKGIIPAYKIAGSFLRFNKKDIDEASQNIQLHFSAKTRPALAPAAAAKYTFGERVWDFFYYNNFYLVSFVVIAAIIYVIFS